MVLNMRDLSTIKTKNENFPNKKIDETGLLLDFCNFIV